jgi:hypothetical protein
VSSAQVGELSVTFGESLFKSNKLGSADITNLASQYTVGDGFRIGARFTLNTKKFIGHEFGYAYSRSKLDLSNTSQEDSMPTHQGFYDFLLYLTPEGTPVRPFAAGGGQFTTFVPPGASVTQGSGVTKYGLNYGGGVKVKVTSIYTLRFDVRDYIMKKPFDLIGRSGALHQIEASVGVGIYF